MLKHITRERIREDFTKKFKEMHGISLKDATIQYEYETLGTLIKDYLSEMWIDTNFDYKAKDVKQVYYFSMEFLVGKLLGNVLLNLGIRDTCKEALEEINISLDDLEEFEQDQGLGNGGLGRLASCFLDSMASLDIPGHGCGIRYKYGFFEQKIINNMQVEATDSWLKERNVWEIKKQNKAEIVKFGGRIESYEEDGKLKFDHVDFEPILAVPYDTPVTGYKNGIVNTLRLWSAEPVEDDFNFSSISRGDFLKAMEYKNSVEAISSVLYPDDSVYEGKLLRLKQQYFFVSAGLKSIIRHFKESHNSLELLDEKVAIQMNDTHPILAVPELMRILLDEEKMGWEDAWRITTHTLAYTNHTILAEALEKWPIEMFKGLLPRIYMIVNEINERFCAELWNKFPGQWDKISSMAIIADGQVRMANLGIVGGHSVNGVAKLHTEILKKDVMRDFYYMYPEKFNNKTNGITHRRWLLKSNPDLTSLLKEYIGDSFVKHPMDLIKFKDFSEDKQVIKMLHAIKKKNKIRLAKYIKETKNIDVDVNSIFDVQVKRIHAYKRQLLNALRIMDVYNRLLENPDLDIESRTFIFGGKAAPSYYLAKNTIELINVLGEKINNDERVNKKIKVVFLDNYRVSLAEKIIPAADVSEQISTTTKEASGTSNMKFMMNGAITVATLDGANVEIRDEVTDDNIVIFGLKEKEVLNYYKNGGYVATDIIRNDPRLQHILKQLIDGTYSKDLNRFRAIYDHLVTYNDEFFTLRDFDAYIKAQEEVDKLYRNKTVWGRMSVINIAHSGIFSSDRTIHEYATGIWGSNTMYKNL